MYDGYQYIILNFNNSTIFLLCYPVWNDKYLFFLSLYTNITKHKKPKILLH